MVISWTRRSTSVSSQNGSLKNQASVILQTMVLLLFANGPILKMSFSYLVYTHHQRAVRPFQNRQFFKKQPVSMIGFKRQYKKRKSVYAIG